MLKYLDQIKQIPGWFEDRAMILFDHLNTLQIKHGERGDIMEIGTYHGKSACVLGQFLRPDEYFWGCDTFRGYGDVEADFAQKFADSFKQFTGRDANILKCKSTEIKASDIPHTFRIWHVDGSHSYENTLYDLELGISHTELCTKAVIIADDFLNPDWLGVSQALNEFLNKHNDWCLVAQGYNKSVLCRKTDWPFYYDELLHSGLFQVSPHNFEPFHGIKYLSLR